MPRSAAQPSATDLDPAPGGVAAVDRALGLLCAFEDGSPRLGLAELSRRSGLYKSTVLRLLASLLHAGFLVREGEAYAPGPTLMRLGAQAQPEDALAAAVPPALRALVGATRESAAFHVRRGDHRLCLYREDSPQLLRDHIRAGDLLPLDRGAGGRVLLAFEGRAGRVYDAIRRDGVVVMSGDRVPDLTGISAPVFGAGQRLLGALTLTLPTTRHQPGFVGAVRHAASTLSARLGA
ncbi:helix-turn-helix domain-containing protein [Ideonella sp. 4Y11]|uniref:Helix-turn-helix domain-containing protein n=1 Tax=Ideonella aquatica TaxID=2824119 RepID=A0A941BI79_9BURK|nr:helix-turn-helix domain-containing protein [Ideonella aquatica]MBQ0957568.1 helix-turn-helix domain-containing protein [Ideonella aquatica]